ncbi:MAG: UDP-N-acetylmuramoyl-L-alanine--D-glutamate ligase, partial [Methylobacteriaceae bacterium]|nr:UDP-N-acetylmuramoyl-L-alanine--D-glutamate ligase [Methylobacteriaceae bacterium]
MTPVACFAGRRVAVFGLGGSGLATARALVAGGASVLAGDDNPGGLAKAEAAGLATADLAMADWAGIDALVLSPGVPLTHRGGEPYTHPVVARARAAGAEVIGDIELFCRERAAIAPGSPFVAITGTNGKSTTTALIAHILREAGHDVQMGGNIGTPILALEPPAPDRVHVVECSSFQIDLTPSFGDEAPGRGPSVGVLLNITPDHLDRHGTMENYAAIKERVVASADRAIVGIDDEPSRRIFARLRSLDHDRCLPLSNGTGSGGGGVLIAPPRIIADLVDQARSEFDIGEIADLRGAHNAQNAAAAIAAALCLGVPPAAVQSALRTFPGLAHRMEQVGRRGRVLFVNDSKATNA